MKTRRPRHGLTSLLSVLLMAVLLVSKASSVPLTQLDVMAGTAPADMNTYAIWQGQSHMWAEAFLDDETWVAAQPGRKFILGVPMPVKSPAGTFQHPIGHHPTMKNTASSFKLGIDALEGWKAISYQQQIN